MKRTGWVLASLILAVALPVGCGGDSPVVESVVLITVDTWRADCFGAGGHPDVRTPRIDRFFRGGMQFCRAYSPSPTTLASHTSMLTGLWPTTHGVPRNGWYVPEDVETLAEILRESGFSTGAFVSSAALDRSLNLGQGFDPYDSRTVRDVPLDQGWRPAAETLPPAREWWAKREGRAFLWVHLFEPHFPYEPNSVDLALRATGYSGPANGSMEFLRAAWDDPSLLDGGGTRHVASLYLAEIDGLDREIGGFLRELELEESVMVVLTSDHGESLGERGLPFRHGPSVFDQDVRVPLLVRGSPNFGAGLADAMVRTIDVPAAILGELQVEWSRPEEAGNLADWTRGGSGLPVFGVASMPWDAEREGEYANLRKPRVARSPEAAVFVVPGARQRGWTDPRTDPGELQYQALPPAGEPVRLFEELERWIADARVVPPEGPLDPEVEDRLRSIGYVD
ncbi:MAG: sulfatase [Gemmatimonadota bacterium]|nr:sulfatase [Gemmatimonadota bacterium]